MGVDVTKEIITGAFYSQEDFGEKYIDKYFTEDEKRFGSEVELIQLNPYCTEPSLPDFILGKVNQALEGSGDRASENDKVSISEIETNESSKKLVEKIIDKHTLPKHPVKTYKIIYFT